MLRLILRNIPNDVEEKRKKKHTHDNSNNKKLNKIRIKIYYARFNVYHPWLRAISVQNEWRDEKQTNEQHQQKTVVKHEDIDIQSDKRHFYQAYRNSTSQCIVVRIDRFGKYSFGSVEVLFLFFKAVCKILLRHISMGNGTILWRRLVVFDDDR